MAGKDDFIKGLASELTPYKPQQKPLVRFMYWFVFSMIAILAVMLFIQNFRAQFFSELASDSFYFLETLFAFLVVPSSGVLLFKLSVPGTELKKSHYFLALAPFILFVTFVALSAFGLVDQPSSMDGKRSTCMNEILILSWLPILLMTFHFSKNQMHFSAQRLGLIGVAGASIPAAFMQLACMRSAEHVLKFHIGPVFFVVVVFLVLAFMLKRVR